MTMITIQQVRQQYPEYDDLSDQELADKLYVKYYSDMPKNDFYSRIGIQSEKLAQPTEAQKIEKFNYITGSKRTPLDTIRDLTEGAVMGAAKGGELLNKGMMQIPGLQQAATAIHNRFLPNINVSNQDVNNLISKIASPNQSMGGEITKGIGEYLPYGAMGGTSLLGQTLAGAGYGAANAQPNQNIGNEAIKGALTNALTHGAFEAFNALRPSQLFRGTLSPQELQSNVEAAKGTPTEIGDIVGSPFLKKQYENIISKLPLSGATEKLQQAGQAVQSKGERILSDLLGVNDPENVTDQIHDALMQQFKTHRSNKNALYDEFNQEANKQFLDFPLKNFSDLANKHFEALQNTNLLKYDPEIKSILGKLDIFRNPVEKILGDKTPVNKFGEPLLGEPLTTFKYPTMQEANILKGKFNDISKTLRTSSDPTDRFKAGIFGDLSSAIKQDINESIEKSGNPVLKQKYKEAEENYAKNFSPFLDNAIYKFIGGKSDPDTIVQSFVKTSKKADRSKALSKLTSALSPEQQPLIAYSYFSRALDNEGNLNPGKLSTLINDLGKNQFKALVPDQIMRDQLKNYNKLYKMNVRGVNIMQNPMTGQQGLDILPAVLAHAGATLTGGMLGGIPGALAGLALPGLIGKPVVNLMTSPNIREALVKAMIEKKPLNKNIIPAIQAGIQGTLNK